MEDSSLKTEGIERVSHHSDSSVLMDKKRSFGNLIKTARNRRGFSQLCLAAHLDQHTVSHVSRIERGETIPTAETVLKLAQILEIDLKDLANALYEIERIRINEKLGVCA